MCTPHTVEENEPYLSLSAVIGHINSNGETCVVYDMYIGYMPLDGTSEL